MGGSDGGPSDRDLGWQHQELAARDTSLALVPVRIAPAVAPARVSIVGPSGYRVDGLDVLTTAMLLRALE